MTDLLIGLDDTTKLIIKQNIEPLEMFAQAAANAVNMDALGALGETANKYDVYTNDGDAEQKYKVIEQSEACGFEGCCPTGRICCRPNHKLELHVFDPKVSPDAPIIRMERPCKCNCISCLPLCRQEMKVYTGDDEIAYIQQPFLGGGFSPTLQIMDREDGEHYATVKANAVCCIGGICCDHTFEVTNPEGESLGKITKERPDDIAQFGKELMSDADNFTLELDKDLTTAKKAAIFSTLHLIDYMFFENEGEANIDLVNQQCTCKVCDCYCCGCLSPCNCSCGGGGGDDGGDDG